MLSLCSYAGYASDGDDDTCMYRYNMVHMHVCVTSSLVKESRGSGIRDAA